MTSKGSDYHEIFTGIYIKKVLGLPTPRRNVDVCSINETKFKLLAWNHSNYMHALRHFHRYLYVYRAPCMNQNEDESVFIRNEWIIFESVPGWYSRVYLNVDAEFINNKSKNGNLHRQMCFWKREMKSDWISPGYVTMLPFKNEKKNTETYKYRREQTKINWIMFEFQSNCILNQLMSEERCIRRKRMK